MPLYLCRLCLKCSEFQYSLFASGVLSKIHSLTTIRIEKNDNFPQTCCEVCLANLHNCFSFQQTIISSDRMLRMKGIPSELKVIELAKSDPEIFEVLEIQDDGNESLLEEDELLPKIEFVDEIDEDYGLDFTPKFEDSDSQDYDSCNDNDVSKDTYEYEEDDKEEDNTSEVKSSLLDDVMPETEEEMEDKCSETIEYVKDESSTDSTANKSLFEKLGIQDTFDKKLAIYRKKHKAGAENYKCTECDQKFETKRMLQRHNLKHKIDQCPYCMILMRRDNLKRHIQIHKEGPEVCEICGKVAKNKESLRGHMNYSHRNTVNIKCVPCNRDFKSNHHYQAHNRKVHLGVRNAQCHLCGNKFFGNNDLKKHITRKHYGSRPYICEYCKRGFSSPYALKTHIRQHTNETPYKCEVCTMGFKQKVSLITHMKSKHTAHEVKEIKYEKCF